MILCRYFDKYGAVSLKTLTLKVNDPSRFNDPFENSAYVEGDEIQYKDVKKYLKDKKTIDRWYETRKHEIGGKNKREFKKILRSKDRKAVFEKIKSTLPGGLKETLKKNNEDFAKVCRVLCFSDLGRIKPHEEILMWSHYSKGHTGIRISFDVEKFKLRSIGPFKIDYQQYFVKNHW